MFAFFLKPVAFPFQSNVKSFVNSRQFIRTHYERIPAAELVPILLPCRNDLWPQVIDHLEFHPSRKIWTRDSSNLISKSHPRRLNFYRVGLLVSNSLSNLSFISLSNSNTPPTRRSPYCPTQPASNPCPTLRPNPCPINCRTRLSLFNFGVFLFRLTRARLLYQRGKTMTLPLNPATR